MHLKPGAGTDTISLTITHVSLNSKPAYEALSYAWGNCTKSVTLHSDDAALHATENLCIALEHLRYSDRPRTLWVDAICIDQSNGPERNLQVQMMRSIYAAASEVLIWLGEEAATDAVAFQLINQFGESGREIYQWNGQDLGSGDFLRMHIGTNPIFRKAITLLLRRPWFRRVWVIQEVAVATRAQVICGSQSSDWNALSNIFHVIRANGYEAFFGTTVFLLAAVTLTSAVREGGTGKEASAPSLLWLLETTQPLSSTEPSDRVFALLSMASDAEDSGVLIDYNLPCGTVYKNLAIHHLSKKRDLRCLSFSGNQGQESGLPSWVPDWSVNANIAPVRPLAGCGFTAGGTTTLDISISSDETTFVLSGFIVDVIQRVGTGCLTFDESDTVSEDFLAGAVRTAEAVNECHDIASMAQPYPTGQELSDIFWRLLICDRLDTCEIPSPDFEVGYTTSKYFCDQYLLVDMTKPVETELEKIDWKAHPMTPNVLQYIASIGKWASGRVFCATKGRLLGWVRRGVVAGDVVFIALGAEVPYILRPGSDGLFKVLGDSYFHGIMDGEALTKHGLTEQRYRIR
jgi:hypothetical protein